MCFNSGGDTTSNWVRLKLKYSIIRDFSWGHPFFVFVFEEKMVETKTVAPYTARQAPTRPRFAPAQAKASGSGLRMGTWAMGGSVGLWVG